MFAKGGVALCIALFTEKTQKQTFEPLALIVLKNENLQHKSTLITLIRVPPLLLRPLESQMLPLCKFLNFTACPQTKSSPASTNSILGRSLIHYCGIWTTV